MTKDELKEKDKKQLSEQEIKILKLIDKAENTMNELINDLNTKLEEQSNGED